MTGTSSIGANIELGEADDDYTDFGCMVDADPPAPETQFVPDKCLGQEDRHVRSIATFIEDGDAQINVKYGQDGYDQLLTWQEEGRRLYGKVTFPKQFTDAEELQDTAAIAKFRCYVKQPKINFDGEGNRVMISLTVKVDSKVTFTKGTSIS
jgi:hypothetical protein